jgi:glycosyltransferase involved in cell wall biosynthesis
MKHFYISPKTERSDITKYAEDFYKLILQERGYIFIDSAETIPTILSTIASRDHVHIELGIHQRKETEILFTMLKANYKSVSVTLHSPPLLKYPFHEFHNPILNYLSKVYDRYADNFKASLPYLKKIKSIYVLTKEGQETIQRIHGINHVYYLPHIVDLSEAVTSEHSTNNFISFDFIGRNKQIRYSLQLHQQLISRFPEIQFYVMGSSYNDENTFYNSLKENYKKNVQYLGVLPEDQLTAVFNQSSFAIILSENNRFYWPSGGSILESLKQGKILFTNKGNAVTSIVENEKNGYYLTGILKKDVERISSVIQNKPLKEKIKGHIHDYLLQNHSKEQVSKNFKD